MMNQARISGAVQLSTGDIVDMDLPVVIFKEDRAQIFYCPALDISGYGKTKTEAGKSLKLLIAEYFDYPVTNNTLKKDLTKLGYYKLNK